MSQESPNRGFLGPLRATALIAVLAGAAGSVGFLMLRTGQRNSSRLLLVVMGTWVLSPFVALVYANVVSKRWAVVTQAALYSMMLVVTLGSVAIYGFDAWKPLSTKGALVFVVVPPLSWLFVSIVVPATAFISARLLRRG